MRFGSLDHDQEFINALVHDATVGVCVLDLHGYIYPKIHRNLHLFTFSFSPTLSLSLCSQTKPVASAVAVGADGSATVPEP
jgi:nitrogen fixation/metabolism regulation signal transduction histidine kinase